MGIHSRPRNGLSLCAGAGGLDMGLMLAEPGFHTRCFVEWEQYPRSAIIAAQRAGYFAPAPIWDDVTTFDGRPFRGAIDTVLAGYPCQPFSQAGQRRGTDDERHLWPDVARIVREIQPEWVFLENVAGHVTLGLEAVLRELWQMGWTPATGLFSAGETGAPHERLRVFILAHRASAGCQERGSRRRCQADAKSAAGLVTESERRGRGAMADAERNARHKGGHSKSFPENSQWEASRTCPHRQNLFPPGPGDAVAWADALATAPYLAPAAGLADCLAWASNLAAALEGSDQASAQSALRRMADGLALRSRALRLLGNGVHPLAAGYAFRSLGAAHGLRPLDLASASFGGGGFAADGSFCVRTA